MNGKHKQVAKNQQPTHITVEQQSVFAGPLPHPDILEGYERIAPGFANRILMQAEAEQQHRIAMENGLLELEKITAERNSVFMKRGQFLAFASVILVVGLGAYALHQGYDTAAKHIVISVTASVVALFVGNKVFNNSKTSNGKQHV